MESPFCSEIPSNCRLIETFRFDPKDGALHLALHLKRMKHSAKVIGFPFCEKTALNEIGNLSSKHALRCRLTLGELGDFDLQSETLVDTKPVWKIAIAEQKLSSSDPWLRHKTTQRRIYDEARSSLPKELDELLFVNEKGEVCEGTITNVFVQLINGGWITPPLMSGCLPGILRQIKLQSGTVRERIITINELLKCRQIMVGNSLRGEILAELL